MTTAKKPPSYGDDYQPTPRDLISVREACKIARTARGGTEKNMYAQTLRRMILDGRLQGYRDFSGCWWVSRAEVNAIIEVKAYRLHGSRKRPQRNAERSPERTSGRLLAERLASADQARVRERLEREGLLPRRGNGENLPSVAQGA